MSKYYQDTIVLAKSFLKDTNECVKRNTSFLLGLVGEYCPNANYNEICLLLEPLLQSDKVETRDNALAAMIRLIITNENNVPNSSNVIQFLCQNVPFKGD